MPHPVPDTAPIVSSRLRAARAIRRLSLRELAPAVGLTAAAVSHIENERVRPRGEVVTRLALALNVAPGYLTDLPPIARPDDTQIHYRARARIPAEERHRVEWLGAHWYELLHTLRTAFELPDPPHRVPLLRGIGPVEAAQRTRQYLGFKEPGPVYSMVEVLETLRVLVVRLSPGETKAIDAYCHWHEGRPVVVLNPAKMDRYRGRFDTAHELGHLVLHEFAAEDEREPDREADQFAGEFLVPSARWKVETPASTDPRRYLAAKARWRVSVKCLLKRTAVVGRLTDSEYRYAMMRYSELGWHAGEPEVDDISPGPEIPSAIAKAFEAAQAVGWTMSDVAAHLQYGDQLLRDIVGVEWVTSRPARRQGPMTALGKVVPFAPRAAANR